jgi:hypothetical protein
MSRTGVEEKMGDDASRGQQAGKDLLKRVTLDPRGNTGACLPHRWLPVSCKQVYSGKNGFSYDAGRGSFFFESAAGRQQEFLFTSFLFFSRHVSFFLCLEVLCEALG